MKLKLLRRKKSKLDINNMTSFQLRKTIAQLKRLADEKESKETVAKTGQLKFDLYSNDFFYEDGFKLKVGYRNNYFSKNEIKDFSESFNLTFKVMFKKGTKFYCYLHGSEEYWRADGSSEEFDSSFAKQYLTNIKKVAK